MPTTTEALEKLKGVDTLLFLHGSRSERFLVDPAELTVLDQDTGLIWEKSPSSINRRHAESLAHCDGRSVGGLSDWRLPEIGELETLVDTSNSKPALPSGHPFMNVQNRESWSATSVPNDSVRAWSVFFGNGSVNAQVVFSTAFPWCVR